MNDLFEEEYLKRLRADYRKVYYMYHHHDDASYNKLLVFLFLRVTLFDRSVFGINSSLFDDIH